MVHTPVLELDGSLERYELLWDDGERGFHRVHHRQGDEPAREHLSLIHI